MRNPGLRLLLALACALAPARATCQSADQFTAVRDTIRRLMDTQRIPAVAVAVAKGDRILWEEAFGYADIDNKVAATTETMFSLASISKPFTATGMMTLVERKAIDLDRPANDYLGAAKLRAFEGDASGMTVRRILSHSAGLPLHYQFFYEGGTPAHSDDVAIARYGFAGYPPGAAYFYSNLGYGIIGYLLGRSSKSTYEDFMRKEVFEPLDLRHTTVSTGKELGTRAAIRYSGELKPFLPYAFDHTAASGVWSSAHDLVRFGMFHVGAKVPKQKEIINAESRAAMQRAEAPSQGAGSSYGLGWATLEDDNGYRRLQHTGGMPGVATSLSLYPSDSVVIVVMINRDNIAGSVGRISSTIAGVVLPRYIPTRDERRAAAAARPANLQPNAATRIPGVWRGFAIVDRDSVPVVLDVAEGGLARMSFGSDTARIVNNLTFANGWFSGGLRTPLRAPEAAPSTERERTSVSIGMRLNENRLTGWAAAIAQGPPAYGAVSYRLELRKQ